VVTDDGVGLEVLEAGDGPGLVLVHGFGGAKEDFADHVDALADRHRVVIFDHRGHGASDKPDDPGAYSLRRMAADVLGVADALGLAGFRLLGTSMGGMVAQHVVLAAPDRVEALVLMSTSGRGIPGIDRERAHAAAEIALAKGMVELRRLTEEAGDPLTTQAHERLLRERPGYREFGDAKFDAQAPAMYAAILREIVELPDAEAALAAVTCPTLVVAGEQDELFLDQSRGLAAAVPGARFEIIADAGHSPQFENPRAWRTVLEDFLGSVG
jgi:pimeloyl-ACP methyl ester carboxylesterase